jgi:F0F1-type ATP synthase assembly protein I
MKLQEWVGLLVAGVVVGYWVNEWAGSLFGLIVAALFGIYCADTEKKKATDTAGG